MSRLERTREQREEGAAHHRRSHTAGHGALFLPPLKSIAARRNHHRLRARAGSGSTSRRSRAAPRAPALTAQHEEQHAGQRGHDHQQGQPDALPHGAAGGSRRDPGRAGGRGGPAAAPPPAADRPGGQAGRGSQSERWRGEGRGTSWES